MHNTMCWIDCGVSRRKATWITRLYFYQRNWTVWYSPVLDHCSHANSFAKYFAQNYSLIIRQKGERQNGGYKKTKHSHVRVNIRGKEMFFFFFGKFDVLCFVVTTIFRIILLPYYRRNVDRNQDCFSLTEGLRNFSWIF